MNLFHAIKQDMAPEVLKLLVEISRGDFVKYEYNNEIGVLEVDRVLYGPVHYPVVYTDVPGTWNIHDGDPKIYKHSWKHTNMHKQVQEQ